MNFYLQNGMQGYLETFFGFFVWDPSKTFFVVPGVGHPISWYGLLFAFGFLVGYFFTRTFFYQHLVNQGKTDLEAKKDATLLTDRLSILAIAGTIIGSRLGHVFFYEWSFYRAHPLEIFKVWEGGLASHGGAVGILLALCVFVLWNRRSFLSLTFLVTLDAIVSPAAFVGGCIRIGNFINQEILGKPTDLPWGVIFLHPVEQVGRIPLHPVQLYESFGYFAIFVLLMILWNLTGKKIGQGLLAGTFFLLVFGLRFLVEFLKLPQSELIDGTSFLNMGQWLSIPFIVIGIILLATYPFRRIKSHHT